MDPTLTVRSLLRFVELRHGVYDDLTPEDYAGTCGEGLKVLLRKCRRYISEVDKALGTRVDDVIRLMRAFYDQRVLLSKFKAFFRDIFEKAFPAILRRKSEPLPRLLSFLEPYGNVQLTFLLVAAEERALAERASEFEPSQLLDTVQSWVERARLHNFPAIARVKVKTLVRFVAYLEMTRTAENRAQWAANCLWASVLSPDMGPDEQRLEVLMRDAAEMGDPGNLLSIVLQCQEKSMMNMEFLRIMCAYLSEAFASASLARVREVLQDIHPIHGEALADEDGVPFSGPHAMQLRPKLPYNLKAALSGACHGYAAKAPPDELLDLLKVWTYRQWVVIDCVEAAANAFVARPVIDGQQAIFARCGVILSDLGVRPLLLGPLYAKLTDRPAYFPMAETGSRLRLLAQLYAAVDAPMPRLPEVGASLCLVGPSETPLRPLDKAADVLTLRLARQLPDGIRGPLEGAIRAWRQVASYENSEEEPTLAAVVAPHLLAAAANEEAATIDRAAGDVARCVSILRAATRGEAVSLRETEWALVPFAEADATDRTTAIGLAVGAAARGGVPADVVSQASSKWLAVGASPDGLAVRMIRSALTVWEHEGVRGQGLEKLRAAHGWLAKQLAPDEDAVQVSLSSVSPAQALLRDLTLIIDAIDGRPPSMPELSRARAGALVTAGPAALAALGDAVAYAWSSAVPGLSPGAASGLFDMWWNKSDSPRSIVEQGVRDVIQELRWKGQLRMQATWAGGMPQDGFAPAWRVEGRARKVPWFVPEEVVAEVDATPLRDPDEFGVLGGMREQVRGGLRFKESLKFKDALNDKASEVTGGRCIYCGSIHELQAWCVWPVEIGGQRLGSNLAPRCGLCAEFMDALGPKRWGEVLAADPKKAADVWWTAQKKANMRTMNFLK